MNEQQHGDVVLTAAASPVVRNWLVEYTSPNTRDAYQRDIDRWLGYCAASGLHPVTEPGPGPAAAAAVSAGHRWSISWSTCPP